MRKRNKFNNINFSEDNSIQYPKFVIREIGSSKQFGGFFRAIKFITAGIVPIFFVFLIVKAAPPLNPYSPGETLAPTCSPGDDYCTVTTPAVSGANSDITSISGLTTALNVGQGGTGLSTVASGSLLYASDLDTISALSLDSTLGIASGVLSVQNNSITGAKIALGSDAQGDIMYYSGTDWIRLGAGTSGQYLQTQGFGANPQWATVAGGVTSIFSRTGDVVAAANDYTWAQIDKTTSSLADITTASAGDLSSGNLAVARMPLGGAWDITTDLNVESNTFVIGSAGGSYAGNVGIGTSTPGATFTVGADAFTVTSAGVVTAGTWNGTAIGTSYLDSSVILSTEIDSYSELNTLVSDVTLTHNGLIDTYSELNTIVADKTLTQNELIDTSSEIAAIVGDETGSGALAFATQPTFTTDITSPLVIGGTATTSDLSFKTTTGVGATGADMHFLVGNNGGTEAMTILNSGNVGIGTMGPGQKLELYGDASLMAYNFPSIDSYTGLEFNENDAVKAYLLYIGSGFGTVARRNMLELRGTGGISFWPDGSAADVTVQSAGNVGIGTTGPDVSLEINNATGGEIRLTYNDSDGSASNHADFVTDENGGLTFTTTDSDGAVGHINFNPDGNVGIGQATPVTNFQINGRQWIGSQTSVDTDYTNAVGTPPFTVVSTAQNHWVGMQNGNNAGHAALIALKTRSTGTDGNTAVQDDDGVFKIVGYVADGTNIAQPAAQISAEIDGSVGENNTPGRLTFHTAAASQADATTERMRIDSSGNIGIGTASPSDLLEVSGPAGSAGIIGVVTEELTVVDGDKLGQIDFQATLESDGTDAILVGASIWAEADDTFAIDNNSTELVFATGASETATEKMRIDHDGNVGIGTATPGAELHIAGTTPEIRIGDDGAEDTSLVYMGNAQDFYIALDDTTDDLTFGTGTTIGSNVKMVIENGGEVGIGTTTPGETLEVVGDYEVRDSGDAKGYRFRTSGGALDLDFHSQPIYLSGYDTLWATQHHIMVIDNDGTSIQIGQDTGFTSAPRVFFADGYLDMNGKNIYMNGGWLSGDGGDEGVYVAGSGNVGIGTASPSDLLEVSGPAGSAGIIGVVTEELTVVDGDKLGQIDFQATLESSGTDAILVGASIWAEADDTFDASTNDTDLVFATGLSETAAEKMRLTSGGNLGIGEVAPSDELHVAGQIYTTTGLHVGADADTNLFDDASNGASSTTMYIGNASIDVTASDIRLKENIIPSQISALELIESMPLVDFDWKEGTKWAGRGRATGLIAQEMYEYFPQVVDKPANEENIWSVEYHHLVPYLIKGIQELNEITKNNPSTTIASVSTPSTESIWGSIKDKIIEWFEVSRIKIASLFVKDLTIENSLTIKESEQEDENITGKAEIEKGKDFIEIKNKKITKNSKIFVSWLTRLYGAEWWICKKIEGELFKVCIDKEAEKDLIFDYWIVQIEKENNETQKHENTENNETKEESGEDEIGEIIYDEEKLIEEIDNEGEVGEEEVEEDKEEIIDEGIADNEEEGIDNETESEEEEIEEDEFIEDSTEDEDAEEDVGGEKEAGEDVEDQEHISIEENLDGTEDV